MPALTANLQLNKPTVGGDADAWGAFLNSNADILDAAILDKRTGGVVSGNITAQQFIGSHSGSHSGDGSALTNLNASNVATGTLDNARTTATASSVANTLVQRDATGGFLANAVEVSSLKVAGQTVTGGLVTGDKNRVINGAMQVVNYSTNNNQYIDPQTAVGVAERFPLSGTDLPNSLYGGPEMFSYNANRPGGVELSQGSALFENRSRLTHRQTVKSQPGSLLTSNYQSGIEYRFEGFQNFDLIGKPVTISFIFNTNVTGTYSVALRDANPTATAIKYYVSSFSATANAPQRVVISVPAVPSDVVIPNSQLLGFRLNIGFFGGSNFVAPTANAWATGRGAQVSGSAAWYGTVGNFIEIAELQLEEGSAFTGFSYRHFAHDLALTQRYFEKSYAPNIDPATTIAQNNAAATGAIRITSVSAPANSITHSIRYSVPKRLGANLGSSTVLTPTTYRYNLSSGAQSVEYLRADGVNGTASGVTADNGTSGHNLQIDIGAKGVGALVQFHYAVDARI